MAFLGIKESDIEERFIRASKRGGQKVNKTSCSVYLKYRPMNIEVKCQKERSQALNRFLARRILADRVESIILGRESEERKKIEKIKRQKRRRSRRAKEKMLRNKKIHSEKKELRRPPVIFIIAIIFFNFSASGLWAKTIELQNGEKIVGEIVVQNDNELVVSENRGEKIWTIKRREIQAIRESTQEEELDQKDSLPATIEKIWKKAQAKFLRWKRSVGRRKDLDDYRRQKYEREVIEAKKAKMRASQTTAEKAVEGSGSQRKCGRCPGRK